MQGWHRIKLMLPAMFFGYAAVTVVNVWQEAEISVGSAEDLMKGRVASQIDDAFSKELPARDFITGALGAARFSLLGDGRDGVLVGSEEWLFTDEEARPFVQASEVISQSVAQIAAVSEGITHRGGHLVLVPLPAKIDIARSKIEAPVLSELRKADYDQFLTQLRSAKVPVVDTRATFESLGEDAFFATDTHWRVSTALAVASTIAAQLKLPKGDAVFSTEPQADVTFSGDLVSFVTEDSFAPYVGLTPEVALPFVAVETQITKASFDLFAEEDTVEAVLIGTSYSANPDWSFVEALKVELGRDVLNLASEGQGPVPPMQEFMSKGHKDLTNFPELVVWEFPIRYLSDPDLWGDVVEALQEDHLLMAAE